jgi:hypothetical protein
MSSVSLLWNCAWRTILWGVGLGTGLGAAYAMMSIRFCSSLSPLPI